MKTKTRDHSRQIREHYEHVLGRVLSDAELQQIQTSLFYLGRAINRYRQIQKGEVKATRDGKRDGVVS